MKLKTYALTLDGVEIRSAGRPIFNSRTKMTGKAKSYLEFEEAVDRWMESKVNAITIEMLAEELESAEYLSIVATYHLPIVDSKMWGVPKATKPDIDNYDKAMMDKILTQLLAIDDKIVFQLTSSKWYAEKPKIEIEISTHSFDGLIARNKKKHPKPRKKKKKKEKEKNPFELPSGKTFLEIQREREAKKNGE